MEAIVIFVALFVGMVATGMAGMAWGADSREPFADDHRRWPIRPTEHLDQRRT